MTQATPEPSAVTTTSSNPAGPNSSQPSGQTNGEPAPWAQKSGGDTPWGMKQGPARPRATARLRKTIDGLPAWEPTPPGEVHVRRHGRES